MPKCYSFIRFSRPEQLRGDSLRRQQEAAAKWAAEHGMAIDEEMADLGVSAFKGKNCKLRRLRSGAADHRHRDRVGLLEVSLRGGQEVELLDRHLGFREAGLHDEDPEFRRQ